MALRLQATEAVFQEFHNGSADGAGRAFCGRRVQPQDFTFSKDYSKNQLFRLVLLSLLADLNFAAFLGGFVFVPHSIEARIRSTLGSVTLYHTPFQELSDAN